MKKSIIAIGIGLVLVIGALFLTLALLFNSEPKYYYTQVDNTKYTVSHQKSGTYYTYKMPAYDEDGNSKELHFDTMRELRGAAFLKLKVTMLQGVVTWEEVQWDDIPEKAQPNFTKP